MSPEELSALIGRGELEGVDHEVLALREVITNTRGGFWVFVKEFWGEVPGAGTMVENWHMPYLCGVLEETAERAFKGLPKLHDVIINVSPGTSKSTLFSI